MKRSKSKVDKDTAKLLDILDALKNSLAVLEVEVSQVCNREAALTAGTMVRFIANYIDTQLKEFKHPPSTKVTTKK